MTIFTHIIEGNIPGRFVWEDDVAVAFLTIEPFTPGHVLVVPRKPVDHWDDLDDATRNHVFMVAQRIAKAIKKAYTYNRVALVIAGFEVPHAHVHVQGADKMADINVANPPQADDAALAESADKIRAALKELGETSVSTRG